MIENRMVIGSDSVLILTHRFFIFIGIQHEHSVTLNSTFVYRVSPWVTYDDVQTYVVWKSIPMMCLSVGVLMELMLEHSNFGKDKQQ